MIRSTFAATIIHDSYTTGLLRNQYCPGNSLLCKRLQQRNMHVHFTPVANAVIPQYATALESASVDILHQCMTIDDDE
jgi:hypothetical protein